MRSLFLFFFLLLFVFVSRGQNLISMPVYFQPVLGKYHYTSVDSAHQSQKPETTNIEILKFYISKVQLYQNDSLAFDELLSYHLVDVSDSRTLKFILKIPKNLRFNKIRFCLGIDSMTNVSGVMGGDLDPTKGMYWTWQSGYINFKLEGKSDLCESKDKRFQFHLGGYQTPFSTLQTIHLAVSNDRPVIIKLDIEKFINSIDFTKINHIMSPRIEAVELSRYLSQCFSTNY